MKKGASRNIVLFLAGNHGKYFVFARVKYFKPAVSYGYVVSFTKYVKTDQFSCQLLRPD